MSKTLLKPTVEYFDEAALWRVRRVIHHDHCGKVTTYLWKTDHLWHGSEIDARLPYDPDDDATWAAFYETEEQATAAMTAFKGGYMSPRIMVGGKGTGSIYIKRQTPLIPDAKQCTTQYLWKTDLDWHISCLPINTPAVEILRMTTDEIPAKFHDWDAAKRTLDAYNTKIQSTL